MSLRIYYVYKSSIPNTCHLCQRKEEESKLRTTRKGIPIIKLPRTLSFKNNNIVDFNAYLSIFDWNFEGPSIIIDGRACISANYQALSLLIQYLWFLKSKGTYIYFNIDGNTALRKMWQRIGGSGCYKVLEDSNENFNTVYDKPMFAIRNQTTDVSSAIGKILQYTSQIDMDLISGHEDTLRYIVSELLYNTLEHGYNPQIPSLLQFNWYRDKNQLSFIIADLGVGIKRHLEQTYPPFSSDTTALEEAIKPEISGTFGTPKSPYSAQNNAGMGLFLSSNLGKKLEADTYIVSGTGLLHISPTDITSDTLRRAWPGTFVYMTIGFDKFRSFNFSKELEDLRAKAKQEVEARNNKPTEVEITIDMYNYCGENCEVKYEAINRRDKQILPALAKGKTVVLDFSNTKTATHSFLAALLVTPIRSVGIKAYKLIKIKGANPSVRATIDFIFDSYTSVE